MASIAYVTDKSMIEYHRLNGNHSINFWKPSNSKKIADFNKGDFLFFLTKGTEKGKGREKGIIGYGTFDKNYILTFSQMWTKYKTLNGYPNKETLQEAIVKLTKNHKLPDTLNCIQLNDVVFFQAPVYLSEIGVEISNKVESYIYLDKDDMLNTSKILEVADQVGVDIWSSLFHKDDTAILKDAQINAIHNIYDKVKNNFYSAYDERCLSKYIAALIETNKEMKFIGNSKTEYLHIQEKSITIYLPVIVNTLDFNRKLQYIIGHYQLYIGYIEKSEYHNEIDVCLLFSQPINEELKEILNILSIAYKENTN